MSEADGEAGRQPGSAGTATGEGASAEDADTSTESADSQADSGVAAGAAQAGRAGTARTVFASPDDLLSAVGRDLGTSGWVEIDQQRIDLFADATGDRQWIHVDPVRAAAGPFGAPIAHGYLTLALTNQLLPEIMEVQGASMGVNYGVDKVRFPQPVLVGSRVRASATLTDATEAPGGVQAVVTIVVEIEGESKPACVVESVSRWLR